MRRPHAARNTGSSIGVSIVPNVWTHRYMDAFWVLMLISLAAVPLALTLRKIKPGGPVSMGH